MGETSSNWIRDLFLGRVYSDFYEDPDDGGPNCANQMSNNFRLVANCISVYTM
jgi:hypothetical protein